MRGSHGSKEDRDDHPQEFGREGKEETVVVILVFLRSRVATYRHRLKGREADKE